MNEESGSELVNRLGSERAKFFTCNVLETESIAAAVKGTAEWAKETGKGLGGIIPAAGVSTPATVCLSFRYVVHASFKLNAGVPGEYCGTDPLGGICGSSRAILTMIQILDKDGNAFDLDNFDFVINVNLRGTIDLIRQALVHLVKVPPVGSDEERGVIVMIASSAAFDGQKGQVSYAASKGAIASLTLPLTRDLARYGVRVVTIAPSLFESRMTSMMSDKVRGSLQKAMEFPRRAGQPTEFAMLVRQAVENTMLNGTVLRLDGGMRMPSKM